MRCFTVNTRCERLVASTSSVIVPGYGVVLVA
jgi:hypothetical protein